MGLYESLGVAVEDMVRLENPNNLQIGRPIWILQLWLNSAFELSLMTIVPPKPVVGVKGLRIAKLTLNDGKVIYLDTFENYFQMFCKCKTFTETMTPFEN